MNHRLLKNKRGEDMIVDFWAILVFAVICVLFLILFSLGKPSTKDINPEFNSRDANFMLQSFLRAPAIPIGQPEKSVAEIIAEDDVKNDFSKSEILFKEFFKETTRCKIILEVKGKNKNTYKLEKVSSVQLYPDTAKTSIPGYDQRIYVSLEPSYGTCEGYVEKKGFLSGLSGRW
jgi:hypothetical protein